jgi:hypothetical protein
MEAVSSEVEDATAKLHRAEGDIAGSLPAVRRNSLFVEQRRLDNALAITEAARQQLERSRQQFELVLNSLKKEHQLQ